MKLGGLCLFQRTKRKLKEKTKELHACLLSNLGACVYPRTHPETKTEKKKVPSWELFQSPVHNE